MRDRVPGQSRCLRDALKALHRASVRGKKADVARIMDSMPAEPRAVLCLLQYAGRFRGWEQRGAELRELRRQRAAKVACLPCQVDDHVNCFRRHTGKRDLCECCEEICPVCGSNDFTEWCIGSIGNGPDPNQRTCCACKHSWFTPEREASRAGPVH